MTFYKLGVLGYPLGHSLSPALHQYFLKQTNLSGSYDRFEISPEQFSDWVSSIADLGLTGFNVTIPHKISILPYLKEVSEAAQLIGAVNTVTVKLDGLYGDNTDAGGFTAPLSEEQRQKFQGGHALILGTGGASHAVAYALKKMGLKTITVCSRRSGPALSPALLSDVICLVNATPVGMSPDIDQSPVSVELLKALPRDALVYDLIYNPIQTCLLKQASDLNLAVQDGLSMLIAQGAFAFELWTQKHINLDVIKDVKKLFNLERD